MSAFGVYGVMSYAVAQRAREFAVRIAIGAESRSLFAMITREGLAIAMTATIATVLLVALAACCHPAWSAARVDPMRVLRTE
jgi:putative ABC transport system permease protein